VLEIWERSGFRGAFVSSGRVEQCLIMQTA
jgi:hypothetical protein